MGYTTDTGTLDFIQAREAYEQLYDDASEKRRFTLRLTILYAYNDMFHRKKGNVPSDDDRQFFILNCREMIGMPQTIPTLRAELYREIGSFDECISYLSTLDSAGEYEDAVREKIRKKALKGDSAVFEL